VNTVQKKCVDRKLNLENLFIGPATASLIALWLATRQIQVSSIQMRQNNIGDKGFAQLAKAISKVDGIHYVDFSQNGLSIKAA
jgi:hypothetical protein